MHHTIPPAVQFNVGLVAGACLPVGGITLWNGEMAWAGAMLAVFVACVLASAIIATRH
jgi:hypothetical protein